MVEFHKFPLELKPKDINSSDIVNPSKVVTPLEAIILLYYATLDAKEYKECHIPYEFKEYAEFMYNEAGFDTSLLIVDLKLKEINYPLDEDLIINLFTGGKDSFTSYVKYSHLNLKSKEKNIFIKGLNKAYVYEYKQAEFLANYLNIDLDIVEVHLPKLLNQPEHPMKNLLTYMLAIEFYKVIPSIFSFGYVEGTLHNNLGEELEEEDEEESKKLDEFILEGKKGNFRGSYQSQLVTGDSVEASILSKFLLWQVYGYFSDNTTGTKDEVEAYQYMNSYGVGHESASCMMLVNFKVNMRNVQLPRWTLNIEGKNVIAGYLVKEDKSILYLYQLKDMLEDSSKGLNLKVIDTLGNLVLIKDKSSLKLNMVYKKDFIGDYECVGSCFKCAERHLVYERHFGYNYNPKFIQRCIEVLIKFMVTKENKNNVDTTSYTKDVLKIKWSEIPKKYQKRLQRDNFI